jgi:hypothetical protein
MENFVKKTGLVWRLLTVLVTAQVLTLWTAQLAAAATGHFPLY